MIEYPIPPSVRGWYANGAFELMPTDSAVDLVNIIPRETFLETRKGHEIVIDSLGGSVETLAVFNGSSTPQLLGAYNGTIQTIDVSAGTDTSKGSGFTSDQWQTLNINDKLVFVNGADAPQEYDGTTLSAMTISGTGLTVADLDGVMSFKGRAVYWTQGQQEFWYAAAGAHAGALTEFPIDFVAQEGGGIMEIVTWTRDGGDGIDDLFIIIMESGETLVYQGTDFASDFSMVGRFRLGKPLSIRGSCQLGSDRIIITEDGYVNLSTSLSKARLNDSGNVGKNIAFETKYNAKLYRDNYGWEINFLPSQSLLIVNVPELDDTTTPANSRYIQHVMNTNTGAWCKFDSWQSITYVEFNNEVYFGTSSNQIMKAFSSKEDNDVVIKTTWTPAFNNFEMPVNLKKAEFCVVVTDFNSPSYIQAIAQTDFNLVEGPNLRIPSQSAAAVWDVAAWDSVNWGQEESRGNENVKAHQIPIAGIGFALTVRIRLASETQSTKYYSLKYKYTPAGDL
jgi:hypothetical protein